VRSAKKIRTVVYNERNGTYTGDYYVRHLRNVILASASPRRRELLSSVGLDVHVVPSRYEELAVATVSPRELALIHARGKAMAAVLDSLPAQVRDGSAPIIGADTVVDVDGDALGKPLDRAHARAMLHRLSGRTHQVHTAFRLQSLDGAAVEQVQTTAVRFFELDDEEIAAYLATGDGDDKAGSYGIQGPGAILVAGITGDFYTVMGFPLAAFAQALPTLDWRLLPAALAGSPR
jgi:septum formation protein